MTTEIENGSEKLKVKNYAMQKATNYQLKNYELKRQSSVCSESSSERGFWWRSNTKAMIPIASSQIIKMYKYSRGN